MLVLIGGAGLAFLGYRHFGARLPTDPPAATPVTSAVVPSPAPVTTPPSAGPSLDDFAGTWVNQEEQLVVKLQRDGQQVVARLEQAQELRLGFLKGPGSTVHGTFSDGNESIPASAELSRDGQKLTITLAPPASEYMVVELRKSASPQEIEGIERLRLEEPETYLPLINTTYRFAMQYPDGDQGPLEATVASLAESPLETVIETVHSQMYPGEPSLFVHHFVRRSDGLYRVPDDQPQQAELWLPNRLGPNKSWKTPAGSFVVTRFDADLSLAGMTFAGVLVVRQTHPELGLDRLIHIAPGYGEILVKDSNGGFEWKRFTGLSPADPQQVAELANRHAHNLDQIR